MSWEKDKRADLKLKEQIIASKLKNNGVTVIHVHPFLILQDSVFQSIVNLALRNPKGCLPKQMQIHRNYFHLSYSAMQFEREIDL